MISNLDLVDLRTMGSDGPNIYHNDDTISIHSLSGLPGMLSALFQWYALKIPFDSDEMRLITLEKFNEIKA
ncbi:MAG: hypothetical protein U5K72_15935 [Balneolaceae bacterium]|nr:hypothetical protein [Balneolaceae bacterium]